MTRARIILLGMILCLPAVSRGEVLTFAFEGEVSTVEDPLGTLNFVHQADRVVQTFTFDTQTPDINSSPNSGLYQGISTTLVVSGVPFTSGAPTIEIAHPLDVFDVSFPIDLDRPELIPGGVAYFRLSDQAQSDALTDWALPTQPYDLSLFQYAHFAISLFAPPIPPSGYNTVLRISGTIDEFYLVPEPSSLFLLGVGCFVIGGLRRYRRQ